MKLLGWNQLVWWRMRRRLNDVQLLVLDVDGVLTDGGLWFDAEGQLIKRFDVRDGLGIRLLLQICAVGASGQSPALIFQSQVFLGSPAAQALTQLVAGPLQIALVNPGSIPVTQGEGQVAFVAFRVVGLIGMAQPDPIALVIDNKSELLRLETGQPGLPMAMQLTPCGLFEQLH